MASVFGITGRVSPECPVAGRALIHRGMMSSSSGTANAKHLRLVSGIPQSLLNEFNSTNIEREVRTEQQRHHIAFVRSIVRGQQVYIGPMMGVEGAVCGASLPIAPGGDPYADRPLSNFGCSRIIDANPAGAKLAGERRPVRG